MTDITPDVVGTACSELSPVKKVINMEILSVDLDYDVFLTIMFVLFFRIFFSGMAISSFQSPSKKETYLLSVKVTHVGEFTSKSGMKFEHGVIGKYVAVGLQVLSPNKYLVYFMKMDKVSQMMRTIQYKGVAAFFDKVKHAFVRNHPGGISERKCSNPKYPFIQIFHVFRLVDGMTVDMVVTEMVHEVYQYFLCEHFKPSYIKVLKDSGNNGLAARISNAENDHFDPLHRMEVQTEDGNSLN